MLNKTERNNPNAIEKHFCEYFSQHDAQPLSQEQALLLMICSTTQEDKLPELESDFKNTFHIYPAIQKRIDFFYDFTMDVRAKMTLISWCESFGDISMFLAYIQYRCKLSAKRNVDIEELSLMFPSGIPSKEFKKKAWDMQKVEIENYLDTDNLLDIKNAQKSILFTQ